MRYKSKNKRRLNFFTVFSIILSKIFNKYIFKGRIILMVTAIIGIKEISQRVKNKNWQLLLKANELWSHPAGHHHQRSGIPQAVRSWSMRSGRSQVSRIYSCLTKVRRGRAQIMADPSFRPVPTHQICSKINWESTVLAESRSKTES